MAKIIRINAKCSDMFSASLEVDGQTVGDYNGYVPDWMPGDHYGDYVELSICAQTGKILNWKVPSDSELKKTFQAK